MPQTKKCPCCSQAVPPKFLGQTAAQIANITAEVRNEIRQRARETAPKEPRTPVITDRSPGVVYANAIRRARKLGYTV